MKTLSDGQELARESRTQT